MMSFSVILSLVVVTIAKSSPSPTNSTPIAASVKSSQFLLSSLTTSVRVKTAASLPASVNRSVPPVAPLLAVLSVSPPNSTKAKASSTAKTSQFVSPVNARRAASPVVSLIKKSKTSIINKTSKNSMALLSATGNSPLYGGFDSDEPEDLKFETPNTGNERIGLPFDKNNTNDKFLREIKKNLQQNNEDYDKLNNRRIGNAGKLQGLNDMHVKDLHNEQMKKKNFEEVPPSYLALRTFNSNNSNFVGLTTPDQFAIHSYRKHNKKHKRKHRLDGLRPRRVRPHHSGGNLYYPNDVQRRHDMNAINNISKQFHEIRKMQEHISVQPSVETSTKTLLTMPIDKLSMKKRVHLHRHSKMQHTLMTRHKEYSSPESTTTELMLWTSDSSINSRDNHVDWRDARPSLTTPNYLHSESDIDKESRREKKLQRYVKFIKKNRALLRQFMEMKRRGKLRHNVEDGFFRDGGRHRVDSRLKAQNLDISPGKGEKIDSMRSKNRICQRSVMIPEGPKYNSHGHVYMPAYVKEPGEGDYAATKKPKFLLPACCNCCKKSVLGCE